MRIDSHVHRDHARVVAQILFGKWLIDIGYPTLGCELR
jgi:hypothetical protein